MRRTFRPIPADEIDDEDERCRVRHRAFVARRKQQVRSRPSDFWFVVAVVICAIVIGAALYLVFTTHR